MNVHTGDPITSYEAAAAIEPVRHAHKAKVLAALAQHPGAIASELAEVVGFDPVETRRRLTELKLGGHAYQAHTGVGPSGRREMRWGPVRPRRRSCDCHPRN
jgi:predicted ArsR family transcriptional regulator